MIGKFPSLAFVLLVAILSVLLLTHWSGEVNLSPAEVSGAGRNAAGIFLLAVGLLSVLVLFILLFFLFHFIKQI